MYGSQNGVPKSVILRSQIEARTLDEFIALAVFSPRMISNHTMAIEQNGNVASVEATLHDESILKQRAPFAHTNHLIHHPDSATLEKSIAKDTQSSISRLETAQKCLLESQPNQDLLHDILKYHAGAYPICRHSPRGDLKHSQTIASAIVNIEDGSLTVWTGTPCSAPREIFYL